MGTDVRTWFRRPSNPLKFARGWQAETFVSGARCWTLSLGPLIRARVTKVENERYHAFVETRTGYETAESDSLLAAQRWCEEEIDWLLLETRFSLRVSRTRAVCKGWLRRRYL